MKLRKEYKDAIICTLKCYRLLENHMKELDTREEEVKINDGLSSIRYDGDGIKSRKIHKITENTALANVYELKEIVKERELTMLKLNRLISAIGTLSETEQIIVTCRYVRGLSWFETIEVANYSQRMCHRKLDEAVEKLAYVFYGDQAFDRCVKEIV